MIEKFFDCPLRVKALLEGPAGPFFEGFAEREYKAGYAEITARRHIRAAEHFMYWADGEGLPISDLSEKTLENFHKHLNQCRCPGYGNSHQVDLVNGARLFLKYLRDAAVITSPSIEPSFQGPGLLSEFCHWMRQQRGTSSSTLCKYGVFIRRLLSRLGEDPGIFDAGSLRQFVLGESQNGGWEAAKTCTTSLRMFLRFLIAEGKCATGLDAAIPALAHWRLSSLPRYLQPEEVERIISACDLGSPVGRRDYAILLLLARLALRAGDIVQLRLSDIDWKQAEIQASGKGHRQVRLPLTQEVGDALVTYLQQGRPSTDTEIVFIRSRAPFRAFGSHCAVSALVAQSMRRAGITCQCRGAAHVLRHSAATSMLRQGTSLRDIAAILRHVSIETTKIYAKVDVTTLQQVAQPWPEVELC